MKLRRRGTAYRLAEPLLAIPLAISPVMTAAAGCNVPKPIHFHDGASRGEVAGGIARGELACFTITARINQHMVVTVSSLEHNAVLQVYQPGWHLGREDNVDPISGVTLPGTAEGADAKAWQGRLPASGSYLIVLGTTRGSADYRLEVVIP